MTSGTVGGMTLTEFLIARIAEDELFARAATPPPWVTHSGDYFWQVGTPEGRVSWPEGGGIDHRGDVVNAGYEGGGSTADNAQHIARWDPARVLAECTAKRAIVEDFEEYDREYLAAPTPYAEGRRHAAMLAVTRAAAVYADNPDYREEWRP